MTLLLFLIQNIYLTGDNVAYCNNHLMMMTYWWKTQSQHPWYGEVVDIIFFADKMIAYSLSMKGMYHAAFIYTGAGFFL